jgi:hypothetical protein
MQTEHKFGVGQNHVEVTIALILHVYISKY